MIMTTSPFTFPPSLLFSLSFIFNFLIFMITLAPYFSLSFCYGFSLLSSCLSPFLAFFLSSPVLLSRLFLSDAGFGFGLHLIFVFTYNHYSVYASRYLLSPVLPLLLLDYKCIPCVHLFPFFTAFFFVIIHYILRNTVLLRNAQHK